MYRAFNIPKFDLPSNSLDSVDTLRIANDKKVRDTLESFIQNGIIDGKNLGNHWFPTVKADVFISHSHADEGVAINCANWLKQNFDLDSFIDSCVWGHANKLLKIIDDEYCYNSVSETYDYAKRNQSTSHVHMMLATAITEMMNATECVFFINSENSINSYDAISKTKSPWLFYELAALRTIQRKVPARDVTENFTALSAKTAQLPIEHTVQLNELTPLSGTQLALWSCFKTIKPMTKLEALDYLYKRYP